MITFCATSSLDVTGVDKVSLSPLVTSLELYTIVSTLSSALHCYDVGSVVMVPVGG